MKRQLTTKEKVGIIIAVGLVIMGAIFLWSVHKKNQHRLNTFLSLKPQDVTAFRVYQFSAGPIGTPLDVNPLDPMATGFVQATADFRSYPISRDRAAETQQWFMEIESTAMKWQMSLYIPFEKGEIAVINLGDVTQNRSSYYATFQSRSIYHWYREYSHRWLRPEVTK
jgi:hypothetical protein